MPCYLISFPIVHGWDRWDYLLMGKFNFKIMRQNIHSYLFSLFCLKDFVGLETDISIFSPLSLQLGGR